MPRKRHIHGGTEASSKSVYQPDVTGDASMRLERLSAAPTSTTWYDVTANGKNGTANNAALYSDFQFNGTNNEVTTALEAPLLPATSEWTLQTWVTQTSAEAGTIANTRDGNNGWALRDAPTGGGLEFTPFPFSANHSITPPLDNGDWYHLALTWTPGSPATLKSYVNGALYATVTPSDYGAAGIPLAIGSGTAGFYSGKIDTVRVFARNLSDDEIVRDYNAGISSHPRLITTENLVSQYLPSGMTTTAWTDVTGSNNMTGAVTAPPAFDGNDYYTIGNPADLQFTNNWSVEAWGSQTLDASQGFERLLSKDVGGTNRCFILSQNDTTGVAFAGIFVSGTLKSVQSTTNYADGNYHHYVVTHDGSNLRLYIDGVIIGTTATGGPMDNKSAEWEVGRAATGGGDDYLNGRCDTVRFYNATLSADQIINNYQAGLPAHS